MVNGNVYRWLISNNYVHDVNNISIDAIGGEGTLQSVSSATAPLTNEAARAGFIEYNTV